MPTRTNVQTPTTVLLTQTVMNVGSTPLSLTGAQGALSMTRTFSLPPCVVLVEVAHIPRLQPLLVLQALLGLLDPLGLLGLLGLPAQLLSCRHFRHSRHWVRASTWMGQLETAMVTLALSTAAIRNGAVALIAMDLLP